MSSGPETIAERTGSTQPQAVADEGQGEQVPEGKLLKKWGRFFNEMSPGNR